MKKEQTALLLFFSLGCALQVQSLIPSSEKSSSLSEKFLARQSIQKVLPGEIFSTPQEIILKEIKDLENENIQDEVGKTLKAEAEKSTTTPSIKEKLSLVLNKSGDTISVKKLLEEDLSLKTEDINDEDDDEDDLDDDENDLYDDDDTDDDSEDDINEESGISKCPKFCTCSKGYDEATTARCDTLDDTQIFSGGISHLEVIGNLLEPKKLNLGPHALHDLGLPQLESVIFVDVNFTEFDKTVFNDLPDLYTVNLTRTNLHTLDPELFQNCTQLNILAISGHNFQKIKTKEYLLNAPSLNEIVLSNNSLTKLPRMAFAKMPELMYINLRSNQLTSLDRVTFRTLESLGELDLSDNQLRYFSPKFFEGLELRTLRITNNKFVSLQSIISENLTVLDASGNRIKQITKDDLSGIPFVDQLFLKSNGLMKISPDAFSSLDQLTFLDISNNYLTSITEVHFKSNPRLQILNMNNNPDLQSLPVFVTNTEEHGTFSIYGFECSFCGLTFLEEKTFDAMPALTRLDLSKNRLESLPKDLFLRLRSLRDLNLSGNSFSKLEPNMFLGAGSLTKLNLAGNSLKTLQVTPFLDLPNLFRLDVSENLLERVWSEARQPLKMLRSLSVRYNWLKRYTVEELKVTPELSGLNMDNNPLLCNKDLKDTIEYLTKNAIVPKQSSVLSEDFRQDNSFTYEAITQWSDLAKKVCRNLNVGPPSRTPDFFSISNKNLKSDLTSERSQNYIDHYIDDGDDDGEDDEEEDTENETDDQMAYNQETGDGIISFTSSNQEEDEELFHKINFELHTWSNGFLWPVMIAVFVTLIVFWLVTVFLYISKRRRSSPVIRPPLILRQGFNTNKNCGLVYKPLQEEIPTPHMPKRGSFYSSSTFHYDKIVPESV